MDPTFDSSPPIIPAVDVVEWLVVRSLPWVAGLIAVFGRLSVRRYQRVVA
ncbi:MAG: hypothetical protein R6W93_05055 [Candidatus Limnocylindrales bacterium]